jgi:predicted secreted protein
MTCRRLPVCCAAITACLVLIPVAWAETDLHLADTATVMTAPDEIAATLRAEATNASASDAQAQVNATMQEALSQARKIAGITVSTGGYGVWRAGASDHWQVSQALNLTGHDAAALLSLVGALQQKGMVVSSLGWRLSHAAERQAHQQATKQALTALRGRVDEAAGLLDMRFAQYKQIRLDGAGPQPMLRGMAVPMAMSTSSAAPPTIAPEDVPVSATAEADATLLPR